MSFRSLVALTSCASFVGCFEPGAPGLPLLDDPRMKALVVVALGRSVDDSAVLAIDPAAPEGLPLESAVRRDGLLVVLGLSRTLAEVGLTPGAVALAPAGGPRRPLPMPDKRLRYDPEYHAWQDERADLTGLDSIRLPPFDPNVCYALGLCPDVAQCALESCPAAGAIAAPAAPLPPEGLRWSCPVGWASLGESGEAGCAERRESCGPGLVLLPGDSGCRPLGVDCPAAGSFGTDPGRGRPTIFVRQGATGLGTQADPMGDLAGALVSARPGEAVAFDGAFSDQGLSLVVPADVRLSGVCVQRAHLDVDDLTLEVGAIAEDLTVVGQIFSASTATVVALAVEGRGLDASVLVVGGQLYGRRLSISGGGAAIAVNPGAVALAQVETMNSVNQGIFLNQAILDAQDIRIEGPGAQGIHAQSSTITGRRISIRDAGAFALHAIATPTWLSEVSIEDGIGGIYQDGAPRLHLERVYVARPANDAIVLYRTGAAVLEDLRLESEGPAVGRRRGGLVLGTLNRDTTVRRLVVLGAESAAVLCQRLDTLRLFDFVGRGGVGDDGGAVGCFAGARLEVERARISGYLGYGVVSYLTLEARISDVEVSDLTARTDGGGAFDPRTANGVDVQGANNAEVIRAKVRDIAGVGLNSRDTAIVGSDLDVDGALLGLEVAGNASLRFARARLQHTDERGFEFRGFALEVEDVEIRGTRAIRPGSTGLAIRTDLPEETLTPILVRRLLVEGSGEIGLFVVSRGDAIIFSEGAIVRGHPIGVGLLEGEVVSTRLLKEVDLRGNVVAIGPIEPQ